MSGGKRRAAGILRQRQATNCAVELRKQRRRGERRGGHVDPPQVGRNVGSAQGLGSTLFKLTNGATAGAGARLACNTARSLTLLEERSGAVQQYASMARALQQVCVEWQSFYSKTQTPPSAFSFSIIAAASSLETSFLIMQGADSTRALAWAAQTTTQLHSYRRGWAVARIGRVARQDGRGVRRGFEC